MANFGWVGVFSIIKELKGQTILNFKNQERWAIDLLLRLSPWTHPFQHFLRVASGRPHLLKHMVCRQHATYNKHRPKDVNVVQFKIMCPASSCVLYSRPADGWEAVRPWNSYTQSRTLASQGNRAIVHQLPGNTQLKMAVNFPVMNFSSTECSSDHVHAIHGCLHTPNEASWLQI